MGLEEWIGENCFLFTEHNLNQIIEIPVVRAYDLREFVKGGQFQQWIPCAKNNPKERGTYLTLAFDHGNERLPNIRILNYGTSRKWDNGRDKLNPVESRIKYWMPLPSIPTTGAKQ